MRTRAQEVCFARDVPNQIHQINKERERGLTVES